MAKKVLQQALVCVHRRAANAPHAANALGRQHLGHGAVAGGLAVGQQQGIVGIAQRQVQVVQHSHHADALVLCPILHVTLGSNPLYFIALMAPVEFAAAALGTFFCCIFHCEETTSALLSLTVSVLCILGGTFFSLDGLGPALAFISKLSPVKWLNEAFFTVACDHSLTLFWPVFLGATVVSALLVLGCRLFFRTEDYL